MMDGATQMDAMYRLQRHIYDFTRKPYLLGRDSLIDELNVPPQGRVLEIACGTARNLLHIARRYSTALCFGVDISEQMLQTARASMADRCMSWTLAIRQDCPDSSARRFVRG
jgi:S-adenosylmethionine-diacylgycerolhomoserine-N-methlytransferase